MRYWLALAICGLGVLLVLGGVAWLYPPAALVIAGVFLVAFGAFVMRVEA